MPNIKLTATDSGGSQASVPQSRRINTQAPLLIDGAHSADLSEDRTLSFDPSALIPTPAGTNQQVQFNDSGAFGANAGLTFDKAGGTLEASRLNVVGTATINDQIFLGSPFLGQKWFLIGSGVVRGPVIFQQSIGPNDRILFRDIPVYAGTVTGAHRYVTSGEMAAAGGSTSPGGSDTQVQFNDGSSFGGDAKFQWTKVAALLTVSGAATVTGGVTTPRVTGSGILSLLPQLGADGPTITLNALGTPRMIIGGQVDPTDGLVPGGVLTFLSEAEGGNPATLGAYAADDTTEGPYFFAVKSRGSFAAPTPVQDGDTLFHIVGQGFDSTSALTSPNATVAIDFKVDGTPGVGTVPGQLGVRIQDAAGSVQTRLVMRNDGRMLVTAPIYQGALDVAANRYVTSGELTTGGGGSTTPAAPANSVQFNNAGSFGGDADLAWYASKNTLRVSGTLQVEGGTTLSGTVRGYANPWTRPAGDANDVFKFGTGTQYVQVGGSTTNALEAVGPMSLAGNVLATTLNAGDTFEVQHNAVFGTGVARGFQVSGAALFYRPAYQGQVNVSAQRYVTSGELTAAITSPASPPGSVQFNNAGGFGGTAAFRWASATSVLTVSGIVQANEYDVFDQAAGVPLRTIASLSANALFANQPQLSIQTYSGFQIAQPLGTNFGFFGVRADSTLLAGDVQISGARARVYGKAVIGQVGATSDNGRALVVVGSGYLQGSVVVDPVLTGTDLWAFNLPVQFFGGASRIGFETIAGAPVRFGDGVQISGGLVAYTPLYNRSTAAGNRYVTSGELAGVSVPSSPAGSVQFNNAGAFGGDGGFTFAGRQVTLSGVPLALLSDNSTGIFIQAALATFTAAGGLVWSTGSSFAQANWDTSLSRLSPGWLILRNQQTGDQSSLVLHAVQISGGALAFAPLYQRSVASANRYVTSGELAAAATTNPGAPVNSVQFNNAGGFGGDAGMTFAGNQLTLSGAPLALMQSNGAGVFFQNANQIFTSNGGIVWTTGTNFAQANWDTSLSRLGPGWLVLRNQQTADQSSLLVHALQISGGALAFAPLYQRSITAAQRYVTSGELAGVPGLPDSPNTALQFNDGGVFGAVQTVGSGGVTWEGGRYLVVSGNAQVVLVDELGGGFFTTLPTAGTTGLKLGSLASLYWYDRANTNDNSGSLELRLLRVGANTLKVGRAASLGVASLVAGDTQTSGTAILYGPAYQGQLAVAAQRYVTSGELSGTATAPAPPNTALQINNGGAFGATNTTASGGVFWQGGLRLLISGSATFRNVGDDSIAYFATLAAGGTQGVVLARDAGIYFYDNANLDNAVGSLELRLLRVGANALKIGRAASTGVGTLVTGNTQISGTTLVYGPAYQGQVGVGAARYVTSGELGTVASSAALSALTAAAAANTITNSGWGQTWRWSTSTDNADEFGLMLEATGGGASGHRLFAVRRGAFEKMVGVAISSSAPGTSAGVPLLYVHTSDAVAVAGSPNFMVDGCGRTFSFISSNTSWDNATDRGFAVGIAHAHFLSDIGSAGVSSSNDFATIAAQADQGVKTVAWTGTQRALYGLVRVNSGGVSFNRMVGVEGSFQATSGCPGRVVTAAAFRARLITNRGPACGPTGTVFVATGVALLIEPFSMPNGDDMERMFGIWQQGTEDNLFGGPLYNTAVAGANRYLTSGELGTGTGTPASPFNAVQFNSAGAFGGDSAFTWDTGATTLTVSGFGAIRALVIGTEPTRGGVGTAGALHLRSSAGVTQTSISSATIAQGSTGAVGWGPNSAFGSTDVVLVRQGVGALKIADSGFVNPADLFLRNVQVSGTALAYAPMYQGLVGVAAARYVTSGELTTAAGNPAAPTLSVQFNNGGIFGGDGSLTWQPTPDILTVSGIVLSYSGMVFPFSSGALRFGLGFGAGSLPLLGIFSTTSSAYGRLMASKLITTGNIVVGAADGGTLDSLGTDPGLYFPASQTDTNASLQITRSGIEFNSAGQIAWNNYVYSNNLGGEDIGLERQDIGTLRVTAGSHGTTGGLLTGALQASGSQPIICYSGMDSRAPLWLLRGAMLVNNDIAIATRQKYSAVLIASESSASPITLSGSFSLLQAVNVNGSVSYWTPYPGGVATLFMHGATYTPASPAIGAGPVVTLADQPVVLGSGAFGTCSTVFASPTYQSARAGAQATMTERNAVRAHMALTGVTGFPFTVTERNDFRVYDTTGSNFSVPKHVGVRVNALVQSNSPWAFGSDGITTPSYHLGPVMLGVSGTAPQAELWATASGTDTTAFMIESVAPSDYPNMAWMQGRAGTSGAVGAGVTWLVAASGYAYQVESRIVGKRLDTGMAGFATVIHSTWMGQGFTVSPIGTPTYDHIARTNATQTAYVLASGDSQAGGVRAITVVVSGQAAQVFGWHCTNIVQTISG